LKLHKHNIQWRDGVSVSVHVLTTHTHTHSLQMNVWLWRFCVMTEGCSYVVFWFQALNTTVCGGDTRIWSYFQCKSMKLTGNGSHHTNFASSNTKERICIPISACVSFPDTQHINSLAHQQS